MQTDLLLRQTQHMYAVKFIYLDLCNMFRLIYSNIVTEKHNYRYAPHNEISVNEGPPIRRWSHSIVKLAIVLQLPAVFSTVTCCTGL